MKYKDIFVFSFGCLIIGGAIWSFGYMIGREQASSLCKESMNRISGDCSSMIEDNHKFYGKLLVKYCPGK